MKFNLIFQCLQKQYLQKKKIKNFVPAKHLEETLACFEIIAKLMNFPFKKESKKLFRNI